VWLTQPWAYEALLSSGDEGGRSDSVSFSEMVPKFRRGAAEMASDQGERSRPRCRPSCARPAPVLVFPGTGAGLLLAKPGSPVLIMECMTVQERTVDSIMVGRRHRTELGDLKPLIDSIQRYGLLQPITVTADGVLICGRRRLEAIKRLGWRTVSVWLKPNISEGLEMLIAEYDENTTHKPLTVIEQAALYREIRDLIREDAARRQQASRFGSGESPEPVLAGLPVGSRHERESRAQASRFVSGCDSHQRLERIISMERIAADKTRSSGVRRQAESELATIRNGGAVDPGWERVQALVQAEELNTLPAPEDVSEFLDAALKQAATSRAGRIAENRRRREAQADQTKRSMRSFNLKWAEQVGWSRKYAAEEAALLKPEDWAIFTGFVEECHAFIAEVERLRSAAA
jgi:ParB family chromosome partitioning protein